MTTAKERMQKNLFGDSPFSMRATIPLDERFAAHSARERIRDRFSPFLLGLDYRGPKESQSFTSLASYYLIPHAHPAELGSNQWVGGLKDEPIQPFILPLTDGTQIQMGVCDINNAGNSFRYGDTTLVMQMFNPISDDVQTLVYVYALGGTMNIDPPNAYVLSHNEKAKKLRPYALVHLPEDVDRLKLDQLIEEKLAAFPEEQRKKMRIDFYKIFDGTIKWNFHQRISE